MSNKITEETIAKIKADQARAYSIICKMCQTYRKKFDCEECCPFDDDFDWEYELKAVNDGG